ncbi:DNA primase [Patescibacteria group bacterium]|jgi:DNA primase|nr:DNA primase [Patescibacteria group bacterium]
MDPVDQIKERLSVVEVVSSYVQLKPAGKNFKGLSPFNREKTPSFYVSPDRGVYYCFSSGKGGDIFTFVQEMEGLDFRGALKILADRAGVELTQENKEARDQRERLFQAMEAATVYFEEQLAQHEKPREYLQGRGLSDESRAKWRLGYAPPGWRNLFDALTKQGFDAGELERVGLVKRSEKGGYYDRFRGRILFPLFDVAGRVIAFSGRIFDEESGKENAKYLNSPETPLFDKSRVLYGYDRAKAVMRKYDFAILVEGQMDLMMSHQGGFPNTVAVSGTGLTEAHLTLIKRLTGNVVMAFDADRAGLRSAERGTMLALSMGMEVKVASLPPGVDPADLVKEDPQKWKAAIKGARHIIEVLLEVLAREAKDERQFSTLVRREVLPFVARIQSPIDRAHFTGRIAERLGVPESAVAEEVAGVAASPLQPPSAEQPPRSGENGTSQPGANQRPRTRTDVIVRFLVPLTWLVKERPELVPLDPAEITRRLETLAPAASASWQEALEHERERHLFEAELALAELVRPAEEIEELLQELARVEARAEGERVARALREAERRGDEEEAAKLLARSVELARLVQGE